jgi:hypothetical protein
LSAAIYDSFLTGFARGHVDWEGGNFKVMLVTDDYDPEQADDATIDDVRGYEMRGDGYTRGGAGLKGRQVVGGFPREIRLDAGVIEWPQLTGQFRYAVVYDADSGALVSYADMGPQVVVNARLSLDYEREGGVCAFLTVSNDQEGI